MFRLILVAMAMVGAFAAAVLGIQDARAKPDFRGFDPAEAGHLESAMWKGYYEGRYGRLGVQTLSMACGQ